MRIVKRFNLDKVSVGEFLGGSTIPPETANVIGSFHTGVANFGLRNGGVNFYSETINTEVWERVLVGKERVK